MTTTLTLDPEQLAAYRHTAQTRRQQEQSALQRRYRRAQHVAERASRLLRERFGVQHVAAFGSLLRPDLFHAQSDVDLAVWGLSEQAYDKAQAALMAIDPQIAVDLLNMNTATGGLRDAIEHDTVLYDRKEASMNGDDIGSQLLQGGQEAALAARIRSEVADVGQAVERAERLLAKAKSSGDNDWLDGVALNLHSFYTGVEKIFEEIVKEIDGGLPTGAEWHQKLLVQVAAEIPKRRPAVIQRSTRDCLDEYRRFRHTVRNVYTFTLRPARLQDLIAELHPCYQILVQDIDAFCTFLDNLAGDGQS